MTWFLGIRPMLQVLDARTWEEAPARVLSSEVRTHRGSDSTTYSIRISYTYEWRGQMLTSERYDFSSGSSSGRESKARVVRRYPPGHEFMAFVNPAKPAEAVIDREFRWIYAALGGFGGLFTAVGAGVMLFGLRQTKKKDAPLSSRSSAAPGSGATGDSLSHNWLPPLDTRDARGKITLKNESTPGAAAIVLFLFALLWNGMLSVFLFKIWQGWQEGRTEVFLLLFMTPFILVGIGVIGLFFYTLLSSFNPRITLALSGNPRLGETAGIEWMLTGAADRLRTLTIRLEGVERATTRSGKSSHTEESVFFRNEIVSITGLRALAAGSATVTLPANLMHSFAAPNNRIVWRLVAHGRIDFWPDLRASFPFTVLPASPRRS